MNERDRFVGREGSLVEANRKIRGKGMGLYREEGNADRDGLQRELLMPSHFRPHMLTALPSCTLSLNNITATISIDLPAERCWNTMRFSTYCSATVLIIALSQLTADASAPSIIESTPADQAFEACCRQGLGSDTLVCSYFDMAKDRKSLIGNETAAAVYMRCMKNGVESVGECCRTPSMEL